MIGQTISHYRIIAKLGRGGMGEVYLAEDQRLDRKVAIKFLPAEVATDERARQRLLREAKTAATLDHPNICTIYEVGQDGDHSFIVLQYMKEKPWLRDSSGSSRTCAQPLQLRHRLRMP
jgi:serine/threonine-protein kinase